MSITLTNPVIYNKATYSGGSEQETNPQAGAVGGTIDFNAQIFDVTVRMGTASGSILNAGVHPAIITLHMNLATGEWSSVDSLDSSNNQSGVVPAQRKPTPPPVLPDWDAIIANLKAIRNSVESFTADNQILPGTQVPWP